MKFNAKRADEAAHAAAVVLLIAVVAGLLGMLMYLVPWFCLFLIVPLTALIAGFWPEKKE